MTAQHTKRYKNFGKANPIIIDGKTFSSVAAAARDFGVSERTLHDRIKRGLTPEQAVGLKAFDLGTENPIKVGGEIFRSIAEAARHFGVPSSCAREHHNCRPKANHALTFIIDHSTGAFQRQIWKPN